MITWQIDSLAARVTAGEIDRRRPDSPVVVKAKWRIMASEDGETVTVTGEQEFVYDPAADFTPYDELTEPQVLGWVHGAMGDQRQALEEMATQQLEQQREAPIVLPLPWLLVSPAVAGNGNDTIGA